MVSLISTAAAATPPAPITAPDAMDAASRLASSAQATSAASQVVSVIFAGFEPACGLIMLQSDAAGGACSIVEGQPDAGHLRAYGGLIVVMIGATIGLTLFDRRFDEEFHPRWRGGLGRKGPVAQNPARADRRRARSAG